MIPCDISPALMQVYFFLKWKTREKGDTLDLFWWHYNAKIWNNTSKPRAGGFQKSATANISKKTVLPRSNSESFIHMGVQPSRAHCVLQTCWPKALYYTPNSPGRPNTTKPLLSSSENGKLSV